MREKDKWYEDDDHAKASSRSIEFVDILRLDPAAVVIEQSTRIQDALTRDARVFICLTSANSIQFGSLRLASIKDVVAAKTLVSTLHEEFRLSSSS